tara:strand:+ start:106 stop:759 length:654 start_codon:yes stop_codon:yes gene_type:complete
MNHNNAYVITIQSLPESVGAAERCINSASRFGLSVDHYDAFTPKDNPREYLTERGVPLIGFEEKYSRIENCIAAFCSHFSLWEFSRDMNKEIIIFEHDAIMVNPLPLMNFDKVITFGKPSYGKFNTPSIIGVNPLVHKRYFGGAHAYMVKPSGAEALIEASWKKAGPTDVFLHLNNFPWLQEYYPWCAEVKETFSTIQNTTGCLAKHQYNEMYRIIG